MGRYQPYHDFAFNVAPGASVQAAVAAAAQTILDHYLPDQQATVDAEYNAYHRDADRRRRRRRRGRPGGGERHHRPAHRRRAQRSDAELRQIGPILPGQWQLQPRPDGADAVGRDDASVPARPGLAVPGRAATGAHQSPVRARPQRDRGLRCDQQHRPHPDQSAIAYFWVGFNVNQYNQTMQNVVNQHHIDLVDAAHLLAMGRPRHDRRRDRLLRLEVLLPVSGGRSPRSGTPTRTATPTRPPTRPGSRCCAVPAHPEYPSAARLLHLCLHRRARRRAAHAARRRDHPGRRRTEAASSTTTQHFNTVDDIQDQVVDARVWLGFHFRNSVEQGKKLGNNVADWELKRYFKQADE